MSDRETRPEHGVPGMAWWRRRYGRIALLVLAMLALVVVLQEVLPALALVDLDLGRDALAAAAHQVSGQNMGSE